MTPEYRLYGGWALAAALLVFHFLWCRHVSYPVSFERQLKRGKPWVYIPMRWKGFHKFQALLLARLLALGAAGVCTAMLVEHTDRREPVWVSALALFLAAIFLRLDAFWTHLRYRQQEDAYYLLHDSIREKLEKEGKDYSEAQFRNLASYQHQQRLRKADEAGKLLSALRREKGAVQPSPRPEPVET